MARVTTKVATFDADAHVIECEETWSYFEPADRDGAPVRVDVPSAKGGHKSFWAIDGRLKSPGVESEIDAVKAVRELTDVDGRLRQMDEIGTDVQALYPTIFLSPLTNKPELERALCRSYNRWLAERTEKSGGRLTWAVVPPTMSIESAIDEIRFGHEHGATSVFWRGFEHEKSRLPGDPYFTPLLEEIDRLGLALCVHAATGSFPMHEVFPGNAFWQFKIPGVVACHSILTAGLAHRYPNIRFGIIEFAAAWIPYVVSDFVHRRAVFNGEELDPMTLLAENRIYVTCQTTDDLAYVIKYGGPNNLVAGTDFGHIDTSSELLGLQRLREMRAIEPELIEKILSDNPMALYGLA